ncbi:MAG: sulfotransferase [Desulfobacteraceae bacterium]|nr:sulfotransferase [Desulfobacteraceae bacterium]MBC2754241.1 sulfotransferase [Desulfobacteraceae bacterium]
MLPDHQTMPGLGRLINRLGDRFKKQMEPMVHLDEKELLDKVSHRLSLKDYGDSYFKEGLRQLIDSVKKDTDLTFLGKVLQRTAIERSLENRLKFSEYKKKKPEVFIKNINPPIIILGMLRTGTTFLHRLLAQDSQNRGLYFWELIRPIPPIEGKDFRKMLAKIEYNTYRHLSKQFDHIHVIRDDEYEECILLLTLTFRSDFFYMLTPVCAYVKWCLQADRLKSYEEYFQLLKIYQSETPDKRLTLKAPAHTGSMNEVKRLIPDAMLIQTHRHPVDVCNSVNSMVYSAHCNVAKRVDVRKTAECNLNFIAEDIQRNLFSRKHHAIDVHDIMYEEILSDPLNVVKKFYAKFGIELRPKTEEKMKAFIRENKQHKHGTHKYSAKDFGMTDAQIIERFEEYMNQFGYRPK